uniref:Uncharacterized protein LOC116957520 n=1 Tax=Petromyzon marinus TaxID=7757 RepID=A0AAJ7UFQ2_PETMA|nr:uncharacterized protein LOC116957520 [Petromyzon marinus]
MAWRVATLAVLALQVSAVLADIQDVGGPLLSFVRLPCHFDRTEDVDAITVQWKFLKGGDEFPILYYCDVLKRKTERVIWEGDLREGDAGIGLLDASRDDEGLYSCEVVNIAENKQQKTTVRLTIREPGSSGEQSDPPAAPANQRSEAEAKSGTSVAAIIAATSLCVILVVGSLVYVKWKTNGTRAMVTAYKAVDPGRQGQGGGRPLVTITVTDGSFGGSQVKQVSVV